MVSVQQFTVEVRQYVNIMTVINFLVAIGDTFILALLGIPFAVLWGILSFFMGFIPSIGWWISLIPPFLIAWAQFGIGTALIVLVSYILINGGVQNIVQPQDDGQGSAHIAAGGLCLGDRLGDGARRDGRADRRALTMIVMKILEAAESTRWIAALMRIGSARIGRGEEGGCAGLREVARLRPASCVTRMPFGSSSDKKKAASAADNTAES